MATGGARREEILDTAMTLFESSGLQTSLQDIADACGILPGSLYHHFESKEAIIVEVVRRYRDDLDRAAKEARNAASAAGAGSVEEQVVALGEAVAAGAARHRAALLLTLYEPPVWAGAELVELARQTTAGIDEAMAEILRAGQRTRAVRRGVDVDLLASRICQSMLHTGVGSFHRRHATGRLPGQKCRTFLHGVATEVRKASALDRSEARAAGDAVIAQWDEPTEVDRLAELRGVAREEFGRRGYEATTIRHIGKAAGMSTGTIYRLIGSKEDLLLSIMEGFSGRFEAAWDAVVASDSDPIEKLDGLMWVNINLIARYSEELKLEMEWRRQSPRRSGDLGMFGQQLGQLQRILAAGIRTGQMQVEGRSASDRARSMYEMILTPEGIVRSVGAEASLALARDSVLHGAMAR